MKREAKGRQKGIVLPRKKRKVSCQPVGEPSAFLCREEGSKGLKGIVLPRKRKKRKKKKSLVSQPASQSIQKVLRGVQPSPKGTA